MPPSGGGLDFKTSLAETRPYQGLAEAGPDIGTRSGPGLLSCRALGGGRRPTASKASKTHQIGAYSYLAPIDIKSDRFQPRSTPHDFVVVGFTGGGLRALGEAFWIEV